MTLALVIGTVSPAWAAERTPGTADQALGLVFEEMAVRSVATRSAPGKEDFQRCVALLEAARRDGLTLWELCLLNAGPRGHTLVIGTPEHIADVMEHWFLNGAADGFNVMPAWLPGSLDDFVDMVIPELQRRGLFRTEYEAMTLRENLGLPLPVSRFHASRSVEAAQ